MDLRRLLGYSMIKKVENKFRLRSPGFSIPIFLSYEYKKKILKIIKSKKYEIFKHAICMTFIQLKQK